MGYRKLSFTLLLTAFTFLNASQSYEDYLKEQNSQFTKYSNDLDNEYKAYQKAYQKAFTEYKK